MRRGLAGICVLGPSVDGEVVRSFVPHSLPPAPALEIDGARREEINQVLLAMGRLDSDSGLLPDSSLFSSMYVQKEAVPSSQIEGTQSSLSDLLLLEVEHAPDVPFDDVRDVSTFVRALEHGVKRARESFPLSNRLIREIHAELLSGGRGAEKRPGESRITQNWLGGSRSGVAAFVPPPPERLAERLGALDAFLHDKPQRTSTLLKAALANAQVATIHAFLDGNGRVGRLLIKLLFVVGGILKAPLLC